MAFVFELDTDLTLTTDIVSYWMFEEASGTRSDSFSSNNLTDTNSNVGQTTGKKNNCAEWVDANQIRKLMHSDNAELSPGDTDFTFAGWVWIDNNGGNRPIISKGTWNTETPSTCEYALVFRAGTNVLRWSVSNGTTITELNSSGTLSTGAWYFVEVWHDATNNEIGLRIDNGTANTASHSGGVANTAEDFNFGSFPGSFHIGRTDEWGYWSKLLSSQERSDLYNAGNGNTLVEITTNTETIDAVTLLQNTLTEEIDADTDLITAQNTETIDAESEVSGVQNTETIQANTLVTVTTTQTIDAVTFLTKTFTQPIGAVTEIVFENTEEITANTSILAREPNLVLYDQEDLSTPVGTPSNPLDFGTVQAGTVELNPENPFVLFNDKDGLINSFDAREITISVIQFSIIDEAVGSSDGTADQEFTVAFTPTLDSTEKLEVKVDGVSWVRVTSFAGFQPSDTIYTYDATTGTVTFGDGLQGMIPPMGDNITVSYTPDTQLYGKQAVEQLWIGVQSNGVIANDVTVELEERDPSDTTHVEVIHAPKVTDVTGVWLATDPNRLGTNYFTGGGFDDQTGVITLGTALPSVERVLVDYEYTIEDDAEGGFTQLSDTLTHTFENSIPSNNAKVLNFVANLPSDASSSGMAAIKLKIHIEYKI